MNVIIMYVFLISGTWDAYDYVSDPLMSDIVTLDDCAEEAERLLLRRGSVSSYACVEQADPKHLILPPYDWGKAIYGTAIPCDVRCLMEQSDARQRAKHD
jgi:hypothetical protein